MTKAGTFWLFAFIAAGIATFILFKTHTNIICSFGLEILTVIFLIAFLITDRRKKPEAIINSSVNYNNLNKKEVKK